MEWLIIIPVCLYGGWWLYTVVLGGGDQAIENFKRDPQKGVFGVVVLAVAFAAALLILGLILGG